MHKLPIKSIRHFNFNLLAKRMFDIAISLVSLILLWPLFIAIGILIKSESRGPIFDIFPGIGLNFKSFNLYKFRTTTLPENGGEPKLAKTGEYLRRTKLEDLPQLWNILKGDLSLVGISLENREYVNKYQETYAEILTAKPGLIDIAPLLINDGKNAVKNKNQSAEYYVQWILSEKVKYVREYTRKIYLLYDLKLILLVFINLVYPRERILKIVRSLLPHRRPVIIGIQIGIFILAAYLALFIKFDADIPASGFAHFLKYLPLIVLIRTLLLFGFSLDKGLWRYTGINDLFDVTFSTTLGSLLVFLSIKYGFGGTPWTLSVNVIDWLLNIFFLSSLRLFRRAHERAGGAACRTLKKRTIIIGAGNAAEMLLRDIDSNRSYPYKVIGLIDDAIEKKGLKIWGVPILGTRKELNTIAEDEKPDEFLIAIPSASSEQLADIASDIRQYGLPIKTLPCLWDLHNKRDALSKMKEVNLEDILFRTPVCDNVAELEDFFQGKTVMITGAGGSIGSELSRQILSLKPDRLILFERHEESLYKIDLELKSSLSKQKTSVKRPKINSVIGDILDERRVSEVMGNFRPQVVIHAAAYKHVPLMEENQYEAVKTNVMGTKIAAEKSREFGVERFILISTDKAVDPICTMGRTKKIAEDIVCNLASESAESGAKYIIVRFGNVMGSSGSVVPLFKEQIRNGGPVTITHPETTRYLMTIPEAVNLVLQATATGNRGELFVLDMGKPVKILDLAKRLIDLCGYRPWIDIDIVFTGLRPGEKLHERLFGSNEMLKKTEHPKINRVISKRRINPQVLNLLDHPNSFINTNMVNILTSYDMPNTL